MKKWPCPRLRVVATLACAALLGAGGAAWSQATNSSIKGAVRDINGPVPIATVVAVDKESGFQYSTQAGEDGSFFLSGLKPGVYEIKVSSEAYEEQTRTVQLLLGQEVSLNFILSPSAVFLEGVTVVGESTQLLVETRSSEIATNVSPRQIESLPQNNRNFLAFAGLAPGVRFTDDQDAAGQTFRSGGANPKQVNVFIDGVSFKNDLIQGGAFMQDSSRGNPFPQNAVQEYKVLTQNFKAEYEKAAAAVITAVTRSGGNQLRGDAFFLFQDQSLVEQDDFARARGDEEPDYDRGQYGLSIGGPLVADRLHYFLSAEVNNRDGVRSVFRGAQYGSAPANVRARLDPYPTGSFVAPLESQLWFGKLSWQPGAAQTLDFSYHRRDEEETRGFGNQQVEQLAELFEVTTDSAVLRHQKLWSSMLNEASFSYQKMEWSPSQLNPGLPRENFVGLLDIGGKDSFQDLIQDRVSFRDDFTWMTEWHGGHTVKTGLSLSKVDYEMTKSLYGNGYFEYRSDEAWQFPFLARFGAGDPALDFGNTQYGIYLQDDWAVLPNLTVNVGVRWDYETNMLNNDWETPADVASGLRNSCRTYSPPVGGQAEWCISDLFDVESYISTGSNRSSYDSMIQPRVGFSWDVRENGETVVFGGWGQYYDRVTLNDIFDEQYRHVFKVYTFCFTDDGTQPAGCSVPAIPWDPAYLSAEGLAGLIARGQTPGPEVFLLNNETRPPRSNQWSVGLRQKLGNWLGSLTYANARGYNGLAWSFGTLPPGTAFNDRWGAWIGIPNYGFILRSYDVRRTEYDGVFLTLDKPYTSESGWGANFAYTYSKGYQNASLDEGTAFSFDFIPTDWPLFPANQDERHRVVMSGTVGLPLNFALSSVITLGSGVPYSMPDASQGWDRFVMRFNAARGEKKDFILPDAWGYRSVDLRLEWEAPAIGDRVRIGVLAEAFNVFDFDNYTYTDWVSFFKPPAPEVNANFGKPTGEINTRRFQLGLRLRF
ncbi:MAG: TonB-dependent receptor [Thermoanaerobaculia bacterium]|nr:MAG: TonB-dependent receptor [Thermoanaerobaculia bacterium]